MNKIVRVMIRHCMSACAGSCSPGRVLCKVLVHGPGLVTWIEGGMQNRLTVCVLESEGYVCLSAGWGCDDGRAKARCVSDNCQVTDGNEWQ